jgi:hypothetical protein
MADTEFGQLSKQAAQNDLNPVQRQRYEQLKAQGAALTDEPGARSSASGLDTTSILKNATALNDFYKQQNQPVVQSYQASKAPLEQRYKDLISSIKGNQTVAENRQILTTNNEMGRRGLSGSSGVTQQAITDAVNPITQQYTGLQKDTLNQQNMDMSAIDRTIAELSAGNPTASMQTSQGIADAARQAAQFQQTLQDQQAARQQDSERQARQDAMSNALTQLQIDQTKAMNPIELALAQTQLNKARQPAQPFPVPTPKPTAPKPTVVGMSTNSGPVYYSLNK